MDPAIFPRCETEAEVTESIARSEMASRLDAINHPPHYQAANGMEAIDVIESFDLNFNLGNAAKYLLRHGKKGDALTDLRKCLWYVQREIDAREKAR